MELAVFNDCRDLVEKFVQQESPQFMVFCEEWKAMMFQHLYSVQSNNVEVMQTTAAALHIAKRIACGYGAENGGNGGGTQQMLLLRRIGGIYLMYAIYFKQPNEQFVKVQASLESWKDLKSFIDTLPLVTSFDDVRYTFWKLVQSQAFRFTALDYCVGLEQLVDYDQIDGVVSNSVSGIKRIINCSANRDFKHLAIAESMMPSVTILEDGYNEMKELQLTTKPSVSSKTLPPTTIFKEISKTLERVQKVLNDTIADTKTTESPASIQIRRRSLKRKGFQVEHSPETNAIEDTVRRHTSLRRMSVRTVFTEQLPKELLHDLQQSTDSNDADEE